IAYMVLVRRRLAADEPAPRRRRGGPRVSRWVEEYGLVGREVRLRLAPGSPWAGRRLDELKLRARFGINVLAIERQRPFAAEIVEPAAGTVLRVGDALYVDFRKPAQNLDRFWAGLRKSTYRDRKSTRLNSSHVKISYAVFCLKKKKR